MPSRPATPSHRYLGDAGDTQLARVARGAEVDLRRLGGQPMRYHRRQQARRSTGFSSEDDFECGALFGVGALST